MRYLLILVSLLISQIVGAAELEDALRSCRVLAVEADRLACYDRIVVERRDVEAAASTEQQTAARDASPEPASPTAEEKFGFEFSVKDAPESLISTIADVRKNAKGGLVLTLANDQIWQQSDSQRLFLDAGDSVTIYRGAFSAFYLAVDGKGRRYRFARVE